MWAFLNKSLIFAKERNLRNKKPICVKNKMEKCKNVTTPLTSIVCVYHKGLVKNTKKPFTNPTPVFESCCFESHSQEEFSFCEMENLTVINGAEGSHQTARTLWDGNRRSVSQRFHLLAVYCGGADTRRDLRSSCRPGDRRTTGAQQRCKGLEKNGSGEVKKSRKANWEDEKAPK